MLTVFLVCQRLKCELEIGVFLTAHVKEHNQQELENFNEVFGQDGERLNVDILTSFKSTSSNTRNFKLIKAADFKVTIPMYIVACPKEENLGEVTSYSKLPKNCLADGSSHIYFDVEQ